MRKLIRRIRFILNIKRSVPFLIEFFLSNLVPMKHKTLAVLLFMGYLIFPFDLVPDFLGFFGILDDLSILTWVLQKVVSIAPKHLKEKYDIKE